jgi:hypothetical protein
LLPFDKTFKDYKMGCIVKYIDAETSKGSLDSKPSKKNNPNSGLFIQHLQDVHRWVGDK